MLKFSCDKKYKEVRFENKSWGLTAYVGDYNGWMTKWALGIYLSQWHIDFRVPFAGVSFTWIRGTSRNMMKQSCGTCGRDWDD